MSDLRKAALLGAFYGRRQKSLLVVEDEPAVREMVADNFRMSGYAVEEASSVGEAWELISRAMPNLVLLDWMLPDSSGMEFLRRLRREEPTRALPVIMLTARGEEADRIRGLNVGADDYLGKPFSLRELEARVKAVLRRAGVADFEPVVRAGGLEIDLERHRVMANSVETQLGPTEFRLLHFLMSHPERVFSRTQLLDNAWGHDVYIEERTVDVHVRRLRRRLEPSGTDEHIQTVRGVGYKFSVAMPPQDAR
ncbi:MAG: phosphate regulon transcriptional regulatory protein PhoB [Gammaproteobacteria bacterium]|nr:phosphate regulon transcriptional regulatory protein PhoB [Gammaproteobacteria bacterium]